MKNKQFLSLVLLLGLMILMSACGGRGEEAPETAEATATTETTTAAADEDAASAEVTCPDPSMIDVPHGAVWEMRGGTDTCVLTLNVDEAQVATGGYDAVAGLDCSIPADLRIPDSAFWYVADSHCGLGIGLKAEEAVNEEVAPAAEEETPVEEVAPVVADEVEEPAAPADEEEAPYVDPLVEQFPVVLDQLFGDDGKDLGLVIVPSNDDWLNPLDANVVTPIDEDGGVLGWSTGYYWGTFGPYNDGNGEELCRFAGPWGGPTAEPNYTYWVFGVNHTTDVGAFQLSGDHYPGGSVSVSSGHPTMQDFANELRRAVGHNSGTNDAVSPAPRIGIFIVDAESCDVIHVQVTYLGDDVWEWSEVQTGTLPLVGEWLKNTDATVFDVLD